MTYLVSEDLKLNLTTIQVTLTRVQTPLASIVSPHTHPSIFGAAFVINKVRIDFTSHKM